MASNHSGTLLASSCKAAQAEHANILLTETETWTKVASLQNGHALTIVQMAFRFGFCEKKNALNALRFETKKLQSWMIKLKIKQV